MAYYNESLYDNTTYFWDYMVAGNAVSGDIFFLLFFLIAPFMLTILIVKASGRQNNLAFLSGSVVTSFISLIMYALGSVGQHIPIICGTLLMATVIMYKLTED